MAEIKDWDVAAANNNDPSPDGAPEGMAPSGVNDVIRENMAVLARWLGDTNGALTATGTADAQLLAPNRTVTAYARGDVYAFRPVADNTGACTLNVSSLGAKSIKTPIGTDPLAGALDTNSVATVIYDGTNFVLVSGAGSASFTTLTASGTVDFTGATVSDLGTVTTADINGGTIDGVTIGGASAGAGTFTDLTASGSVDFSASSGILWDTGDTYTYDSSNNVHVFSVGGSSALEANGSGLLGLNNPSYNIDATGESSFWIDPAATGTLLNRVTTSLSGAVVRVKDEGTLLYEHTYLGNYHIFNTYSSGFGIYSFAFGGVGKFNIGEDKVTTGGTHRTSVLELGDVTPPSSAASQVSLYSESGELKVVDAAGNVTTLSPHNFSLIPEGPSEDMAWGYYSERDGKKINVDMLKALRILEQLSGEKLVYEEN